MCPVFRWDDRAGSVCKANDLPVTLAKDLGRIQLLELVPGLAINRSRHAFAGAYAGVVEFDNRRWFGWRRGRREVAIAEDATRSLRKCRSPFPLIQIDGPLGSGACTRSIAGGAQNRCQR